MLNRKFSSMNEIPKRLRRVDGGALSQEQATDLINAAQAEADASQREFSVCYGEAKAAFVLTNTLEKGFWVPLPAPVIN